MLMADSNGNPLVVDPPLASAPNASGLGDKFTMLMAQYAAAGFQSGVGGGTGGFTTTPAPGAVFELPSLTKPTLPRLMIKHNEIIPIEKPSLQQFMKLRHPA